MLLRHSRRFVLVLALLAIAAGCRDADLPVVPPGNAPLFSVELPNDQRWDELTGSGWSWLRRASSKDPDIVEDPTAPYSPSNVLRMIYTPGMAADAEPSVHWIELPGSKELVTDWYMKLSSNWIPNEAGGGKITFLWTQNGLGQVYTNLYHPCDHPEFPDQCDTEVEGAPYKIGANTEWLPYGQKVWYPNTADTTWINPGEWHHIRFYYKWETLPGISGNGIIKWWVDGVLNGNHTNVHYPVGSFGQFEFAPTVQDAGPAERYMYIDHTNVMTPPL